MKRLILFSFLFVIGFTFIKTNAQTPTVIELFTSQGCSSCPPADQLLTEVQEQYGEDVITLSYHVDYWDYIGWKDPFASWEYTQKQYAYASIFNTRNVYTPQAIINGNYHFTGSDKAKMKRVFQTDKTMKASASLRLPKLIRDSSKVFVDYSLDGVKPSQKLTFALTLKKRVTSIRRGENRNRTLENHNIVVDLTELAVKEQGSVVLHIPDWVTAKDKLAVVAYVSEDQKGIVSALSCPASRRARKL